jgi:superfamily II DNA or RNA helicase
LSLIDQTVESFYGDGIRDIGVIQADHVMTDWSRPVQIASVQTLQRRSLPEASFAIIDECHRWFDFYEAWMGHPDWLDKIFVGLSATPWTKGLGKHFDDLLIPATTQELIEEGYLSPFRVFAPDHPDLHGVRTVAGDYHEGDLSAAMNKVQLVANIVETWVRMAEGRPTLVFAVDCAHAKSIQQEFERAGIPAGYQDAFTPKDERKEIKRKFHSGHYKVVVNVGTLTTGVDWDVRCVVLARPTKSEILFVQIIGRGLRTAEGKDYCLILDHSDTHDRLGFVTDIIHDELDDGKHRKAPPVVPKERLPKECSKCHCLKPAGVLACPNCGFKPQRQPQVTVHAGELRELRGRGIEIPPGMVRMQKKLIPETAFFAELLYYAQLHGKKDGWAAHKFKEATGHWPSRDKPEPITATAEVLSWIKSRNIAWARAKRA